MSDSSTHTPAMLKAGLLTLLLFAIAAIAAGWGVALTWSAISGASGGVTVGLVITILLAIAMFAVAGSTYHRGDSKSFLTGMPTRNSLERVAELMDYSVLTGVPLSYEEAVAFERIGHRRARWRFLRACAGFTIVPALLLIVVGASMAYPLVLILGAVAVWVVAYTWLRLNRREAKGYFTFMHSIAETMIEA